MGIVRRAERYEISPATLVLGSGRDLSSSPSNGRLRLKVLADSSLIFSRPLCGLLRFRTKPSDKSLGYSHSVRFADERHFRFWAKLSFEYCSVTNRLETWLKSIFN